MINAVPGLSVGDATAVYYALGQSMFTPEDKTRANPDPKDRPYAGFLYGTMGLATVKGDHVDNLGLTLGVVGPLSFAEQTQKLAQVDIDTIRLQAGNAYAEHMIEVNRTHLQNLQQDASYQQQQAQQVAAAQRQAQQQAVTLSADLHSSSSQLDAMKQRISELEQQQANPQLVLPPPPAPAATPAPAPAGSAPPPASPSP